MAGLDMKLGALTEIFEGAKLGETGYAIAIQPNGVVFYHPDTTIVENESMISEIGLPDEILSLVDNNTEDACVTANYLGKKVIATYQTIGETGWSLLMLQDYKEAYSTVYTIVSTIIALLVLTVLVMVILIVVITKSAIRPLSVLSEKAEVLAAGDISVDINTVEKPKNEIDQVVNAMGALVDSIKLQADDLNKLAAGNIDVDIEVRSENDYLNISMKKLIDTLQNLIGETEKITKETGEGHLSYRGDDDKFTGAYKELVRGINGITEEVVTEIKNMADLVAALGRGELPEIENTSKGDWYSIYEDLRASVGSIRMMVNETQVMANAALEGDYSVRGNLEDYKGEFVNVIDGINKTLDMIVEKVNWYESIINSIPLPVHVKDMDGKWTLVNRAFTDIYSGDAKSYVGQSCTVEDNKQITYNGLELKQSTAELNNLRGEKIGYVSTLQDLTPEIRLSAYTKCEVERLMGNLTKLSHGSLDFTPCTLEADEYSKETAAQFAAIDESLNAAAGAISGLIEGAKDMTEAAVAGDLEKRLEASCFEGDFATVAEGINEIIDTMLEPVKETLVVLQQVQLGNLSMLMTGSYRGGHAQIKEAVNATITNLREVIEDISNILSAIGNGDLTKTVNQDLYHGEFEAIKMQEERILINLQDIMKKIHESSNQVTSGAFQLSEASQTLAKGSTEQSAAVEVLTASVADVFNQTKQNAENAEMANTLTGEVMNAATRGDSRMREMLVSMDEINQSSANISKIIKVIDDIAFQTNILALNAAVEAARAGVHGKGFAVVADEVRSLAAKSASAANETTALIESSISSVEAGSRIANETAGALSEIVEGISKTAELVGMISSSSGSQAEAIHEVNNGIEEVARVVQSNSATAQQSAASAHELHGQADVLQNLVANFKLD